MSVINFPTPAPAIKKEMEEEILRRVSDAVLDYVIYTENTHLEFIIGEGEESLTISIDVTPTY